MEPEDREQPEERRPGKVPLHRLRVPVPHILPFTLGSFDSIGALSRSAFPHRHTFYEIIHVTHGHGAHVLDMCGRPLQPPQPGGFDVEQDAIPGT